MIADGPLTALGYAVTIGIGNGFDNIGIKTHVKGKHLPVSVFEGIAQITALTLRQRAAA